MSPDRVLTRVFGHPPEKTLEAHLSRMERLDARMIALQKRFKRGDFYPELMGDLRVALSERDDAHVTRSSPTVGRK